jgi:thiol-disulfide isomerase/thioredoxin
VSGGPPSSPPAGSIRVLFAAAVLVASAAGGFLAYRLASPPRATLYAVPQAKATVSLAKNPQTAPSADTPEVAGPRIPERLPDVALPGPDGALHRLSDWHGRPVLVNFWATWCEPCRREIPLLKQLRRERAADRLEVVGIALDFRDAVQKYAAEHGMEYPLLVGEDGGLEAASAFGMDTVLPFSVFADQAGNIVTLKVGELRRDEAAFILDRVGDLDRGQMTLAVAREQIATELRRLSEARAVQARARTH